MFRLIYLSHKRFGIFCHCAYGGIVGWYGTPSQHGHIQFLCQGRELRLGLLVVKFIHEEDTSCILAERRQLDVLLISANQIKITSCFLCLLNNLDYYASIINSRMQSVHSIIPRS